MRRILAITLLIAFGFPLVAPAFAAGPEASLPACCRSHGAHHCAMLHMLMASTGPSFNPAPCPFYPAAVTPPRVAPASPVAQVNFSVTQLLATAPPPATTRRAARTLLASANLKRGPPSLLA